VLQILAAPLLQKLLGEFPISPHPAGLPLMVLLPQQHSHSGCCSLGSTPTQGAASFGSTPTQGADSTAAPLIDQMMTCRFYKPSSTKSGSAAVGGAL